MNDQSFQQEHSGKRSMPIGSCAGNEKLGGEGVMDHPTAARVPHPVFLAGCALGRGTLFSSGNQDTSRENDGMRHPRIRELPTFQFRKCLMKLHRIGYAGA